MKWLIESDDDFSTGDVDIDIPWNPNEIIGSIKSITSQEYTTDIETGKKYTITTIDGGETYVNISYDKLGNAVFVTWRANTPYSRAIENYIKDYIEDDDILENMESLIHALEYKTQELNESVDDDFSYGDVDYYDPTPKWDSYAILNLVDDMSSDEYIGADGEVEGIDYGIDLMDGTSVYVTVDYANPDNNDMQEEGGKTKVYDYILPFLYSENLITYMQDLMDAIDNERAQFNESTDDNFSYGDVPEYDQYGKQPLESKVQYGLASHTYNIYLKFIDEDGNMNEDYYVRLMLRESTHGHWYIDITFLDETVDYDDDIEFPFYYKIPYNIPTEELGLEILEEAYNKYLQAFTSIHEQQYNPIPVIRTNLWSIERKMTNKLLAYRNATPRIQEAEDDGFFTGDVDFGMPEEEEIKEILSRNWRFDNRTNSTFSDNIYAYFVAVHNLDGFFNIYVHKNLDELQFIVDYPSTEDEHSTEFKEEMNAVIDIIKEAVQRYGKYAVAEMLDRIVEQEYRKITEAEDNFYTGDVDFINSPAEYIYSLLLVPVYVDPVYIYIDDEGEYVEEHDEWEIRELDYYMCALDTKDGGLVSIDVRTEGTVIRAWIPNRTEQATEIFEYLRDRDHNINLIEIFNEIESMFQKGVSLNEAEDDFFTGDIDTSPDYEEIRNKRGTLVGYSIEVPLPDNSDVVYELKFWNHKRQEYIFRLIRKFDTGAEILNDRLQVPVDKSDTFEFAFEVFEYAYEKLLEYLHNTEIQYNGQTHLSPASVIERAAWDEFEERYIGEN
jgi:hypothetical protein